MSDNSLKHAIARLDLCNINDELTKVIGKVKDLMIQIDTKLQYEEEKCYYEKDEINRAKLEIKYKEDTLIAKCRNLEICKKEQTDLIKKVAMLESEKQNAFRHKSKLENCREELHNTLLNIGTLREACSFLENQLDQCVMYKREESNDINPDKLIYELGQVKEQFEKTKNQLNEEHSFRLIAEARCKKLMEDVGTLINESSSCKQEQIHLEKKISEDKEMIKMFENHSASCEQDHIAQMASFEQKIFDYEDVIRKIKMQYSSCKKEHTEKITFLQEKVVEYEDLIKSPKMQASLFKEDYIERLTFLEQQISEHKVIIKTYRMQMSKLAKKNKTLKEKNSEQLNNLNNVKNFNRQLELELNEIKEKNKELLKCIDEYNRNDENEDESRVETGVIVQQQIKLIDFLQSKIEKSKNKPLDNPQLESFQIKAVKNALMQKWRSNISLQQQLEQLVSRSSCRRLNTNQIDEPHCSKFHRFETKKCETVIKCDRCSNLIPLDDAMKNCQECYMRVHSSCALFEVSCHTLKKESSDGLYELRADSQSSSNKTDNNVNIEGWIKIPASGSTRWDKYYARLTSSILEIYKQPPSNHNISPVGTLNLETLNSQDKVILEPVMSEISIPIAISDLPCVIKLQMNSNKNTYWPFESVMLMTLNAQDKERWSKALTSIAQSQIGKYNGEVMLKFPLGISVSCLIELNDETKLVGTEKGLYSYRNKKILHIAGLLHVQKILLLTELNICLMIVGIYGYLIMCNLNHLTNLTKFALCSEPTLIFKVVSVNNLCGFRLLDSSVIGGNTIVSVATLKELIILHYNKNFFQFVPIRILITAEPINCLLFTQQSLLAGANKFFNMNLNTFKAVEFLDMSDDLCQMTIGSFPIAILKILNNRVEYLLCFDRFGIFVDESGKHSRESAIRWSRFAQAFYYDASFLYVVQFDFVEILKITPITCILRDNVDCFTRTLSNVQYLGNGEGGIYVESRGVIKYIEGKKVYSDKTSNNSSEGFSEEFNHGFESGTDNHHNQRLCGYKKEVSSRLVSL